MSLYKVTVITEIYKENEENEVVWHKGFRQAKREVLNVMDNAESNVFGATFHLVDGTFLKEIHH